MAITLQGIFNEQNRVEDDFDKLDEPCRYEVTQFTNCKYFNEFCPKPCIHSAPCRVVKDYMKNRSRNDKELLDYLQSQLWKLVIYVWSRSLLRFDNLFSFLCSILFFTLMLCNLYIYLQGSPRVRTCIFVAMCLVFGVLNFMMCLYVDLKEVYITKEHVKKFGVLTFYTFGIPRDSYKSYSRHKNYEFYKNSRYVLVDMSPVFDRYVYMPYLLMKNPTTGKYHFECVYDENKTPTQQPKTIQQALQFRTGIDMSKAEITYMS